MWNWLKSAFSFVSSLAGKVLGKSGERALVNSTCDGAITAVENITERLLADQISVDTWLKECRLALKNAYIQQYLLGIGGQGQLTFKDYGSIGGMLGEQYKYLQNFAREIAAGNLTPGQIKRRIAMYANSAREGYARARARAHGIPEGKIPAFPGQQCECLTSCKCNWRYEENDNEWLLYWELGITKTGTHCDTCLERTSKWYPYIISKAEE
jgi:hypothetical protein